MQAATDGRSGGFAARGCRDDQGHDSRLESSRIGINHLNGHCGRGRGKRTGTKKRHYEYEEKGARSRPGRDELSREVSDAG